MNRLKKKNSFCSRTQKPRPRVKNTVWIVDYQAGWFNAHNTTRAILGTK